MITVQVNTKALYRGQPGGGIVVSRDGAALMVTRSAREALTHAAALAGLHQEVVRVVPGSVGGAEINTPDGNVNDYTPDEIAAASALPDAPPADVQAEPEAEDPGPITKGASLQALAEQFGKVVPAEQPADEAKLLPPDAAAPGTPGTLPTARPLEASGATDGVAITQPAQPTSLQAAAPGVQGEVISTDSPGVADNLPAPQPIEWGKPGTRTAGNVRTIAPPGTPQEAWRNATPAEQAARDAADLAEMEAEDAARNAR